MNIEINNRPLRYLASGFAAAAILLLSACGGGGLTASQKSGFLTSTE